MRCNLVDTIYNSKYTKYELHWFNTRYLPRSRELSSVSKYKNGKK
jgi:hypothetical protein